MNIAYQGVARAVPLSARPDQDIVSEMKVQIGIPSAESGYVRGVVRIPHAVRHNELHDECPTIIRNTKLNARAYNAPIASRVDQECGNWRFRGRPIFIPKVYKAKKTRRSGSSLQRYRVKPGGAVRRRLRFLPPKNGAEIFQS